MITRDFGKDYGLGVPEKFVSENILHLFPLICEIKSLAKDKPILIYDFGGGNGLLALSLLDTLKEYDLQIVIIDEDDSKFISHPRIKNIKQNILSFNPKLKCDYSISRNIFHYNKKLVNEEIFKKIYSSTKKGFLFVNMFILKNEQKYYIRFSKQLFKWFKIFRCYPLFEDIKNSLEKAKWKIKKEIRAEYNNFDFLSFSRRRFNLKEEQIDFLKKSSLNKINTDNTSIFWCDKSIK